MMLAGVDGQVLEIGKMTDELIVVLRVAIKGVALGGSFYTGIWAWRVFLKRRRILLDLPKSGFPFRTIEYLIQEFTIKETYLYGMLVLVTIGLLDIVVFL
jgi:hypothetical protein